MKAKLILAASALVAACALPARAAVDDFGRPFSMAATWSTCPAADQFVGVRIVQMRAGLPGVWIDGRGGDLKSAFGGASFLLVPGFAMQVGAGVSSLDGDLTVDAAGGLTLTWRRLAANIGTDGRTRKVSFGVGLTFWR